jgi:hypothetical protein
MLFASPYADLPGAINAGIVFVYSRDPVTKLFNYTQNLSLPLPKTSDYFG